MAIACVEYAIPLAAGCLLHQKKRTPDFVVIVPPSTDDESRYVVLATPASTCSHVPWFDCVYAEIDRV